MFLRGTVVRTGSSRPRPHRPVRRQMLMAAVFAGTFVAMGCTEDLSRLAEPVHRSSRSWEAVLLTELLRLPAPLQRAENLVTARCMRRKGLFYRSAVRAHEPRAPATLAGRPLGLEFARTHGYGFLWGAPMGSSVGSGNMRPEVLRALEPRDSPRVRVRLAGGYIVTHARRGCVARARIIVYGSLRHYAALTYVPQGIRLRLLEQLDAALLTGRVQEAVSTYAACMRSAGYPAETPRDAWLVARRRFGEESEVSAAQRRMAVADARCQTESAIYGEISRGLAREGRRVLLENRARLRRLMRLRWAALARARRITHHGGRELGKRVR